MITSTTPRGSGAAATRAAAPRPGAGGSGRRPAAARRPVQRVAHLAHMDLDALRNYRQELITEESRVSYWRRILQARMDTAAGAASRDGDEHATGRLRDVLSDHQSSSRRLAVLPVHDAADLPPLPDLTALWESVAVDEDDTALIARLADAESELSAYRRNLHERLDDATSELIARYRDEPALALRALPLPGRPSVA